MFTKKMMLSSMLMSVLVNGACEMKDPIKRTTPSPNPDYPAGATRPEGSSGTVRDQLPAGGAAATGGGVTSSNTSAASGAVSNPDHVQSTPPSTEVPMSAQPQVPAADAGPSPSGGEGRK